jgi:hypothetical protein
MSSETRPSNVIGNLLLPVLAVFGVSEIHKKELGTYMQN